MQKKTLFTIITAVPWRVYGRFNEKEVHFDCYAGKAADLPKEFIDKYIEECRAKEEADV